jgi:hypothetical protein
MESRSNRNDRRNLQREDTSRTELNSNPAGRPRQSPSQKEPVGSFRRTDSRRINWENDLYERQSL